MRKTGKSKEELDVIFSELIVIKPENGTEYLLHTFLDLNNSRSRSESGPQPLSYTELSAYSNLTGDVLTPWEIQTIRAMDRTYMEEVLSSGE